MRLYSAEVFVRKWLTQDGNEIGEVTRSDGGYKVTYHGVGEFHVATDGKSTHLVAAYSDSSDSIEHTYRNQILPLALSRQGLLVVHASALDTGSRCVAFVGVSGRGKSTLAASFASIGYPYLTDDGLVVTVVNGIHKGAPRNAMLSLRDESKEYFERIATVPIKIFARGPKWSITDEPGMPHSDQTLPLTALYFLGEGVADRVRIESMRPNEAIQLLLSNTFVLDTTDKEALRLHFSQISKLVAEVPCFALDYPRDFDVLPLVHVMLGEHMARDELAHVRQPL